VTAPAAVARVRQGVHARCPAAETVTPRRATEAEHGRAGAFFGDGFRAVPATTTYVRRARLAVRLAAARPRVPCRAQDESGARNERQVISAAERRRHGAPPGVGSPTRHLLLSNEITACLHGGRPPLR